MVASSESHDVLTKDLMGGKYTVVVAIPAAEVVSDEDVAKLLGECEAALLEMAGILRKVMTND